MGRNYEQWNLLLFTFRNLNTNMKNSSNMHVYEFFCSLYKEETFVHIYAGRRKLENTAIIESQHSSGISGNSGIMLPENGKKIGMMKTHPFKVFSRKKPNWGQLLHLFLAFIS